MNTLDYVLLAIAALALLSAGAAILISRARTRKTLETMSAMLDAAINGDFSQERFDESLLSAVETRLAQYLSASTVSAKNLSAEKEKIKELIGDISHQTKTPISNILLYTQLLGEQSLPAESEPCVKALSSQAEKLSFLIGSLVKTSRLEAGVFTLSPKRSALMPVLGGVMEQIAPKAALKGISVSLSPTDAFACFDGKWTAEALYNIADNAVKYTPAGGSVSIAASVYELFCRVDIADNGIGIAEEEQARIFGRFYRSGAVSDSEGVGIGLYLARQIVSGEGGYIKVSSDLGKGSVFSVFLPKE